MSTTTRFMVKFTIGYVVGLVLGAAVMGVLA